MNFRYSNIFHVTPIIHQTRIAAYISPQQTAAPFLWRIPKYVISVSLHGYTVPDAFTGMFFALAGGCQSPGVCVNTLALNGCPTVSSKSTISSRNNRNKAPQDFAIHRFCRDNPNIHQPRPSCSFPYQLPPSDKIFWAQLVTNMVRMYVIVVYC